MRLICEACGGQCCQNLPYRTALCLIAEVLNRNPELNELATKSLEEKPDNTAICIFWAEEGCALEKEERPSVCGEFECDLFLIAKQDPIMVNHCFEHGRPELKDLWTIPKLKVYCQPDCPNQSRCRVPIRVIEKEEANL